MKSGEVNGGGESLEVMSEEVTRGEIRKWGMGK